MTFIRDFLHGLFCLRRGLGLVLAPGLRTYVIIPIVINVLVFTGLFVLGMSLFGQFLEWITPDPATTGDEAWFRQALWPLFFIAAAVVMFYTFTLVANLIGAPFNAFLSQKTEQLHAHGTAIPELPFRLGREIYLATFGELRKLGYFALLAVPLVLLTLVPGLNLFAGPLWFVYGAWALALQYLDYPMANHGMRFPEERELARSRLGLTLGLGTGAVLLTLIPGLNLVAMPASVIAATLLWKERLADQYVTGKAW